MFYRVKDVHTAFTTSVSNLQDLLDTMKSQAMSTLMSIIRSENFSHVGKRQPTMTSHDLSMSSSSSSSGSMGMDPSSSSSSSSRSGDPSAPPMQSMQSNSDGFQNIIRDAEPIFMKTMQTRFGDQYGFFIGGCNA